jgi:putative ubiquitin-RnfH superfamily antitoxin RatB of RatAB toxin-antitoxin module
MTEARTVHVVRAWPGGAEAIALSLPQGATVGHALAAARAAGWDIGVEDAGRVAVFGRAAGAATTLHDGDRVELLRPLQADPKDRRRERAGTRR